MSSRTGLHFPCPWPPVACPICRKPLATNCRTRRMRCRRGLTHWRRPAAANWSSGRAFIARVRCSSVRASTCASRRAASSWGRMRRRPIRFGRHALRARRATTIRLLSTPTAATDSGFQERALSMDTACRPGVRSGRRGRRIRVVSTRSRAWCVRVSCTSRTRRTSTSAA